MWLIPNISLERSSDYRGRAVLAMNCVLGGTEWSSCQAAAGAGTPRYQGEGVYVGSEPPEGFTIKGNERSMKYHVPESAGYSRTVAEVWFNSEEAAQQAGFVRAQR